MTTEQQHLVALKAERTNLRRLFTTSCNQFDVVKAEADIDITKLQVTFNKIADKAQRLFTVDSEISTLEVCSEEEFDVTETYRDRFTETKTSYELIKTVISDENTGKLQVSNNSSPDNLKLPKLNLKEYDLNPRSWVPFWGQFARIHEDKQLREEDKFQYLISSLKPKCKARDIAESYPPFKDNYPKVIEHLKSRFGRDDLLIEVYIRDLLTLVTSRGNIKLAALYDKLGSYLRALETLGVTTANYAAMLYPVVESCLPVEVLKAWDRYRLNRDTDSEGTKGPLKEKLLEELMTFLGNEVEGEEHRALAEYGFDTTAKNRKETVPSLRASEPSAAALVSQLPTRFSEKLSCIFCERPHSSQDCGTAAKMTLQDRKAKVMQKKCCLVCLKYGHMAKACRSTVRCIICERRHYALLCPELPKKNREFSVDEPNKKEEQASTLSSVQVSQHIYLKTLMVRLRNKHKTRCVRVLLDDGSHRSYVEEALAEEMLLTPSGNEILSQGLFGGDQTPAAMHRRYDITVESLDSAFSCQIAVLDQPKICTSFPRVRDKNLLSALSARGIVLSDVGVDAPPIQILLGADMLGKLLTGRIEVLQSGISAIETRLGWSVLGAEKRKFAINLVTLSLQNSEIPKLWELETLGINDPIERKTAKLLEEETLTHFKETIKMNEYERYEVALPWLVGHPPLCDNYAMAEAKLHSITKRLKRENIFDSYDNIFHEWKNEGIIEEATEVDTKIVHYLPHRPVLKPSSATTKIRPVFDASAKRPGFSSLNNCLSVGPSLTQNISPLLHRFRMGSIGATADIKQAFLQLSVRPEERDVLRFLWWADKSCTKLTIYRHCRVVFGVTSSPFLLNATISHHLSLEKFQTEDLQETVKKLREGFYVDNLVTSVNNEWEYKELQNQACAIMREGKFDLRCWAHTGMDEQEDQKVLGLKWNTRTDELYCVAPKLTVNLDEGITKRKLLSVVNAIYDPIGFTSIALWLPKLLLQEAWRNNLGWDDELPNDMQKRYRSWAQHIPLIEQCAIPRKMFTGEPDNATLHIFTDASAHAYACCAFIRCEDEYGVSVKLVSAKTRIAPMQRPTIPRLELLGAAIGARLAAATLQALQLPLRTYYWTDSMVVLAWITKNEPWNTFIGNRVKEIREITNIKDWRHVPGEINPADLPSRSSNFLDLLERKWWEGPSWLREAETTWPHAEITCPEEALSERRKSVITNINIETKEEKIVDKLLYFSRYTSIIRMVAWMLRFCHNSKKTATKISSEITCEEMKKAEMIVQKLIQAEWPSEIRSKYGRSIKFYEEEGLLKVKTRLILGDDSEEFQRPIVLPDHPIVRRLIEQTHRDLRHSGVQTTLNNLREQYWIPRGRRVVREVLNNCIPCKRHSSKPLTQESPPLPVDRIRCVAAFQVTGVDLAGPIFLRGNVKAWIVLFTCAVYRAIHLELVTSLSTEAFMQSLRRFFARRGRSSTLYTDNGTNFIGTENALRKLNWNEIQTESTVQKIKWYFSPPSAPWYGGWWERMIRTVKQLLKRSLGRSCLTYEEMCTVLCDCESTINGRPLTYLSDDPNELKPITPAHFIQDIRGQENPDLDVIDASHLLKRIKYLQTLRDNLRKRFRKEYLGELIRHPQTASKRNNLSPGDVVLVGSDNAKRLNWPLARIIQMFPGKDNIQRVVKLRVGNSEIIRPIQRIYPLELHQEEITSLPPAQKHITNDVEPTKRAKTSCCKKSTKQEESKSSSSSIQPKMTRIGRQVIAPKKLDL